MDGNPENQFDFWLGEWEARWSGDGLGTNRVTRILDDKVIQEDFSAPDLHGLSFSVFDGERQLWCQTWVDNNGSYLDFTGTFQDGKMILVRDAIVRGERCQQRMVWYDIASDEFQWNWERSDDAGQTWRRLWQVHYRRMQSQETNTAF
jgi:hypothetical protein